MKLKRYTNFINESVDVDSFKEFLNTIVNDNYKISTIYHWVMEWAGNDIDSSRENIDMLDMINYELAGNKFEAFYNSLNDIRLGTLNSWLSSMD